MRMKQQWEACRCRSPTRLPCVVACPLRRPIRQHATGRQGLYRTLMVEGRHMALDEFREMAREELNAAPREAEPEELERQFWRNVTLNPPLYGGWAAVGGGVVVVVVVAVAVLQVVWWGC